MIYAFKHLVRLGNQAKFYYKNIRPSIHLNETHSDTQDDRSKREECDCNACAQGRPLITPIWKQVTNDKIVQAHTKKTSRMSWLLQL